MWRGILWTVLTISLSTGHAQAAGATTAGPQLTLHLRTRVQPFKGSDTWDEVVLQRDWPARECAIIVCDMWDNHWCRNAARRCDELAHKMAPVISAARADGVQIIHAPSDCMAFYKDAPQRRRILQTAPVQPPKELPLSDPPLAVDSADGGCDDDAPSKTYKAWTRQHAAISIADPDVISDNGAEIYSFLRQQGIKNVLIMGVHTNMCVCNRSFGIKQMTRWGIRYVLVRDLTDAMYNPRSKPFVSHEEGTQRVIQHIEKYWCPSILSSDLFKVK